MTTPLDELINELAYVTGKDRAVRLVAAAVDHLADRLDTSEELRDLTDDHMGDVMLGSQWLRGLAEGLRP